MHMTNLATVIDTILTYLSDTNIKGSFLAECTQICPELFYVQSFETPYF